MLPQSFQWSDSTLLIIFLLMAMVIPALVVLFDDSKTHHLH
jgi:hypothetical protein